MVIKGCPNFQPLYMKKEKEINAGGINGLGEALVNTNSRDFLELKSMIKKLSSSQSEEERIENGFLSIRFQMESYLQKKRNKNVK